MKQKGDAPTAPYPRAKRRFGQNFLVDPGYAQRIVDLADLAPSDTVVEIGPGRGAITERLARKGCRVVALELDRDLHALLAETFGDLPHVEIVEGDALRFDFGALAARSGGRLKVVANLPYNVATPILFHLLDFRGSIGTMVLMFQKEVADRIVAKPGGKDYGVLSIFPQLHADISQAFRLPPGAFFPPPKVFSAVLRFRLLDRPRFEVKDEALLGRLVKAAFSQRRKRLSNSLKGLLSEGADAASLWAEGGIDPSKRAEEIPLEAYCRFSNLLSDLTRG